MEWTGRWFVLDQRNDPAGTYSLFPTREAAFAAAGLDASAYPRPEMRGDTHHLYPAYEGPGVRIAPFPGTDMEIACYWMPLQS